MKLKMRRKKREIWIFKKWTNITVPRKLSSDDLSDTPVECSPPVFLALRELNPQLMSLHTWRLEFATDELLIRYITNLVSLPRNFEKRCCSRSDTCVPTPSCHDAVYVGPVAGGKCPGSHHHTGMAGSSIPAHGRGWVCPTAAITMPKAQRGSSCGNRWRHLPTTGRSYLCKLYKKRMSLQTQLGSPQDPGSSCAREGSWISSFIRFTASVWCSLMGNW